MINLYKCHTKECCPVVEQEGDVVTIYHPDDETKGKVTMSLDEWNELISNIANGNSGTGK